MELDVYFGANETLATKHLLGGFERDLRYLISEYLWDVERVQAELNSDSIQSRMDEPGASPLDFLYLGEAMDILSANITKLPDEVQNDLKPILGNPENSARLHKIRKRDGHNRETSAVTEGDFPAIYTILKKLRAPDFQLTLNRLDSIENGSLGDALADLFQEAPICLNNLPQKDYEATTLVGRKQDVDRVTEELLNKYNPVVSIIAPGGLGKTALALEVAWQFAKGDEFELVLWHSAKTDTWTVQGSVHNDQVETDLSRAVASLGKVIEPSFDGNVDDFLGILGEIPTLLVLDNFETFTGTDFLTFFKRFPKNSNIKVLITSRKGIGSNENRLDLKPLGLKAAVTLLNKLSKFNQVNDILTMLDDAKEKLVTDLNCKPLDLKWFVQSHAAGKTIQEISSAKLDLLNFCVKSVMDGVSTDARRMLGALWTSRRSLPLAEAHLLVGSELIEDLTPIVQELLRSSLIERTISQIDPDHELLQLSEVTQNFLDQVSYFTTKEKTEFNKRRLDLGEEIQKLETQSAPITHPKKVHVRGPEDLKAAILLDRALRHGRTDLDKALHMVADARHMRRDYFEVDRVEAWLLRRKDSSKAEALFERALVEATSDLEKALVSYHFASFFSYGSDIRRAIDLSRMAHETLQNPDTAQLLGTYLARNGEYERGVELLKSAVMESSRKSKLVALTSLTNAYKTWAESMYVQTNDFEKASDLILAGFESATTALSEGLSDSKTTDIYRNIVWAGLKICKRASSGDPKAIEETALTLLRSPNLLLASLGDINDGGAFKAKILDLLSALSERFRKVAEQAQVINEAFSAANVKFGTNQRLEGTVSYLKLDRAFGFISGIGGRRYHFSKRDFMDPATWEKLKVGFRVTFEIESVTLGSSNGDIRKKDPSAKRIAVVDWSIQ